MEVVEPVDPRLLAKAARAGRVRGIGLEILGELRRTPARARSALAMGLRQARALHSRERRFVGDAVRGVIRDTAALDVVLGCADDESRWLGWLVDRGLSAAVAAEERPGVPFDRVVHGWRERLVEDVGPVEAVSVAGSVDPLVAEALVDGLGRRGALAFMAASAERAAVQLRVNTARSSLSAVVTSLAHDGVEVRPLRWAPHGLEVVGRVNLQATHAFKSGWVEVQDEGSQLLAMLVDGAAGTVVDLCAGAGGKALAIAAVAPDVRVVACDVRGRALAELRKRAQRAGASRIRTVKLASDGTLPDEVAAAGPRTVLVDAPCSGLGTLRRHPEQRLRLDGAALEALGALQRQILARAASLVPVGGALVYGTCSVLRSENDLVVSEFVSTNPDFQVEPVSSALGQPLAAAVGDGRFLRVAPHSHGTDGFFGAALRRVAGTSPPPAGPVV